MENMENKEVLNENLSETKTEKKEKKEKKKTIILIIIIILLMAIVAMLGIQLSKPSVTAVILESNEEVHDPDTTGTIRISVEPTITIKQGTMQDLNFFNTNKNRLMSIKIYTQVGDEIKDLVYDSPKIEPNKVIAGDFIDTSKLTKGNNKATVEVYYYDLDGNLIGQTNVKDITLVYES